MIDLTTVMTKCQQKSFCKERVVGGDDAYEVYWSGDDWVRRGKVILRRILTLMDPCK